MHLPWGQAYGQSFLKQAPDLQILLRDGMQVCGDWWDIGWDIAMGSVLVVKRRSSTPREKLGTAERGGPTLAGHQKVKTGILAREILAITMRRDGEIIYRCEALQYPNILPD